MITKSIGKLTTDDVNAEIALYQKVQGFEVPQDVLDGPYKDKLNWLKATRLDQGLEPVEIDEQFFTLNPNLPADMADIKTGDVVLIPIPSAEKAEEKGEDGENAADASQDGSGDAPVTKKYKVLDESGIVLPDHSVAQKDEVVDLDPENETTLRFLKGEFIEEVKDENPAGTLVASPTRPPQSTDVKTTETGISAGQSHPEGVTPASAAPLLYKGSQIIAGTVDTIVHNGRSYVDFQTIDGTMHRLSHDEFNAETGTKDSNGKEN